MKLLIVFLSLSICFASSNFVQVSQSQLDQNSTYLSALNYGFNQVVQQATSNYQISNLNYQISNVHSVYQQSSESSTNYQFNVQFTSASGSTYQAVYTVAAQESGAMTLQNYQCNQVMSANSFMSNFGLSTQVQVQQQQQTLQQQIQQEQQEIQQQVQQMQQMQQQQQQEIQQQQQQFSQETTAPLVVGLEAALDNWEAEANQESLIMTEEVFAETNTNNDFMAQAQAVQTQAKVQMNTFVTLNSTQIQQTECQNAMQYGINQVLQKGVSQGKVSSFNYQVSSINSVQQEIQKNGCNYQYNLVLQNGNNSLLTTNFTVWVQASSQSFSIMTYNYHVSTTTTTTKTSTSTFTSTSTSKSTSTKTSSSTMSSSSSSTQVSSSTFYSSKTIQSCLQYAMQQTLQESSNYSIAAINSISQQATSAGTSYMFDVNLATQSGKKVNLNCAVVNTNSGQMSVTAYSYKSITTTTSSSSSSSSSISSSSSSSAKTSSSSSHDSSLQSAISSSSSASSSASSSKTSSSSISSHSSALTSSSSTSSSSSSSFISTSIFTSSSSSRVVYSQIETTTLQSNYLYQSLLQYGVQQCLQNLVQNYAIVNTNYQISHIMNSYVQKSSSQQDFYFQVQLSNAFGHTLNLNFGVNYQQQTKVKSLTSYFLESMNSQQSSNVLVGNYNSQGGQLDMGVCNMLTSDQIIGKNCQGAINYGISQFNQEISTQSKSSSSFSISHIQNVYQDVINSNTYRVVATLVNSQGTYADCSFSVNYGASSSSQSSPNSFSYVLY